MSPWSHLNRGAGKREEARDFSRGRDFHNTKLRERIQHLESENSRLKIDREQTANSENALKELNAEIVRGNQELSTRVKRFEGQHRTNDISGLQKKLLMVKHQLTVMAYTLEGEGE